MRRSNPLLKTLLLAALLAAGETVFAQGGDQWYSGLRTGFWGVSDSVGVRNVLPGPFNPPGASSENLNAQRQIGGYRITDAFAIEGAQTQFGPNASACSGDPRSGDAFQTCNGAAWSLSGVATLPFKSGLSLYGRLGLNYSQKGFPEDAGSHHNADEPGGISKVYGIGLSYDWTKSITIHADSERYSELNSSNGFGFSSGPGLGLDSTVHSIGLSIKF